MFFSESKLVGEKFADMV